MSTIVCFEHTGQERTDRKVTQGNLTSEVLIENSVIVIVKMYFILLCLLFMFYVTTATGMTCFL